MGALNRHTTSHCHFHPCSHLSLSPFSHSLCGTDVAVTGTILFRLSSALSWADCRKRRETYICNSHLRQEADVTFSDFISVCLFCLPTSQNKWVIRAETCPPPTHTLGDCGWLQSSFCGITALAKCRQASAKMQTLLLTFSCSGEVPTTQYYSCVCECQIKVRLMQVSF